MAIDESKLPRVLPAHVARVLADGRATKETLDNEVLTRDWYRRSAVELDERVSVTEGVIEDPEYGTLRGRVEHTEEVVGDASSGIIKALNDVTTEVTAARGPYGTLNGRVSNTETVVGNAASGLVKATNDITAEVSTARGGFTTLNGRVSNIATAVGDASSGLVKATNDLTAEVSNARGGYANVGQRIAAVASDVESVASDLTTVEATANGATASGAVYLVAQSAPAGFSASYGWQLVAGLKRIGMRALLDNAGNASVAFEAEKFLFYDVASGTLKQVLVYDAGKWGFTGDVAIDGDLLVTGSVTTGGLADQAVNEPYQVVGTTLVEQDSGLTLTWLEVASLQVAAGPDTTAVIVQMQIEGGLFGDNGAGDASNPYFRIVSDHAGVMSAQAPLNVGEVNAFGSGTYLTNSASFFDLTAPATATYRLEVANVTTAGDGTTLFVARRSLSALVAKR